MRIPDILQVREELGQYVIESVEHVKRWALQFMVPKVALTTNSVGTPDKFRVPQLGSTGLLDVSFLPSTVVLDTEYVASDVLTKIKTVDGSGSGLDADLLDGSDSAAYAKLASANEFTQTQTVDGGTAGDATLSNASLQLGNTRTADGGAFIDLVSDGGGTYPDYGLRVIKNSGANGTTQVIHRGTGALEIRTNDAAAIEIYTNGTLAVTINSSGNVIMAGNAQVTGLVLAQKYRAISTTTLADDATTTLTTAGLGLVYVANTTDGHHFLGFFSSGGVVEISDPSGTWAQADTDTFNCLYWSSGLVLKNRRGGSRNYVYHIFGSTGVV